MAALRLALLAGLFALLLADGEQPYQQAVRNRQASDPFGSDQNGSQARQVGGRSDQDNLRSEQGKGHNPEHSEAESDASRNGGDRAVSPERHEERNHHDNRQPGRGPRDHRDDQANGAVDTNAANFGEDKEDQRQHGPPHHDRNNSLAAAMHPPFNHSQHGFGGGDRQPTRPDTREDKDTSGGPAEETAAFPYVNDERGPGSDEEFGALHQRGDHQHSQMPHLKHRKTPDQGVLSAVVAALGVVVGVLIVIGIVVVVRARRRTNGKYVLVGDTAAAEPLELHDDAELAFV